MSNIKNAWYYIKTFRANSIFWRTFLFITIMLIVPFLTISIIIFTNMYSSTMNDARFENYSTLDNQKNILDSTLMECDMMSSYIATDTGLQNYMLGSEPSGSFTSITTLAKTLPIIYKYIDSIYIYSEADNSVVVSGTEIPMSNLTDKEWLKLYPTVNHASGIVSAFNKNGVYPALITIIKPVYVADEKKGAVIMNLNSQSLFNSTASDKYKNGQSFFILNDENKIILSSDISYFNTKLEDTGIFPDNFDKSTRFEEYIINGEKQVILCAKSDYMNFTYASIYPTNLYDAQISRLKLLIVLISLALIISAFIIAYIISVKSYAPLHEIISFLDTTAPDDGFTAEEKNELKYIINSIQLHIEDKEKMADILEERMNMLKKAQYEMLQSQINPHFLYNTLDTINWMAYDLSGADIENPVSKSLVSLATFFRNTLSASGYLITISEEIQFTKDYLDILMLRYGGLFDIKWDIDEKILSHQIIKICLQPIIENAVYHGFKPKNEKGLLIISGKLVNQKIQIKVSDDGIGMDAETLEKLNLTLHGDVYTNGGSHIGLANVNKRIKIIFGNGYGLHAESSAGKGTTIYITIPITK